MMGALASIENLYAVMGHPIHHSRSPWIHEAFGRQSGMPIAYKAMDVPADQFESRVAGFLAEGGRGFNCTIPLKELAFRRADLLTDRAAKSGAVNTMKRLDDGLLLGDNTDGHGLRADLENNLRVSLECQRILVLGAGGAARGIIAPLLERHPAILHIANRTEGRACELAGMFEGEGNLSFSGLAELKGPYDLVLNATAASLYDTLPPLPDDLLADKGICYDLAYGSVPTPFVFWGNAHGARISCDGLGMLVEQAALAFELWLGFLPDTQPVIKALRETLSDSPH